ncbi:GNAT family N-acetyltransferase [Deinococcus pimensis]|uniref:GNAT family N-acetyltransferase n=1 Tax=Deinococcus pimensis TaxID=309888 RepID=UPI0004B80BB4|nr:GNAT family protein [Deinococcus pimensis]
MTLLPVTLASDRLRLEPLEERHLPGLVEAAQDPELWRYLGALDLRDPARLTSWLELVRVERERGDGLAFVLVDVASNRVVGSSSLYEYSAQHRRVEIGRTWIVRSAWRSWLNTEAKSLLLTFCFEDLGLGRVQLKTDARNERSQRAIERLGAQREGVLRAHMVLPDGYVRDTVMYAVTRADWPAVRARLLHLRATRGGAS